MISDVVAALGSTSHDDRHPCPLCGSKRGIAVNEGKEVPFVIHCHACNGDFSEWLKENGFMSEKERPSRGEQQLRKWDQDEEETLRETRARSILYRAKRSHAGQPEEYLHGRGIENVPPNAMLLPGGTIKTLPGLSGDTLKLRYGKYPAMVFPIRKQGEGVVGAHLTFLSNDGVRKLKAKNPKRTYGLTSGGYVQLGKPDPERPLIVAEGIETALSAAQLAGGLPAIATCGTSGMRNLQNLPSCAEVIIARDLGKDGLEAAKILAARLVRRGKQVRIAPPPKKKISGKWQDWNDVLQNNKNYDPDELEVAILKATKFTDDAQHSLSMNEFLKLDIPPMSYLIKPVLINSGMTMIHARAGHGKTRFALSLAYAYASGEPIMQWQAEEPGKALYVDAELTPEVMKAWLARLGTPTKNLEILSDKLNWLYGQPRVSLVTEKDRDYLDRQIRKFNPELVVLDALFTLAPPDMLEGKTREDQWTKVIEFMRNLKRDGRHVVLLHHDNKAGSQYGQSIKEIEFDLMMQLKKRTDYDDETANLHAFELGFPKARHLSAMDAASRIIVANGEGVIRWEHTDAPVETNQAATRAQERRAAVKKMTDEGKTTKQIADELGITAERVRQLQKRLREEAFGEEDE